MCEICSKFIIKKPEQSLISFWCLHCIAGIEQISHIVLLFLLLTFNKYMPAGNVATIKKKVYNLLVVLSLYKDISWIHASIKPKLMIENYLIKSLTNFYSDLYLSELNAWFFTHPQCQCFLRFCKITWYYFSAKLFWHMSFRNYLSKLRSSSWLH